MKKDPGIPNLFPFKEQLLKQLKDRKEKAQDEQSQQKLARMQEAKRKRSLQDLCTETREKNRTFEEKVVCDWL